MAPATQLSKKATAACAALALGPITRRHQRCPGSAHHDGCGLAGRGGGGGWLGLCRGGGDGSWKARSSPPAAAPAAAAAPSCVCWISKGRFWYEPPLWLLLTLRLLLLPLVVLVLVALGMVP